MKGKSQAGRFFKIQMDMKDKCPLNLHLTLHSPSADFLSALLYSSLWRAYDVLKCLQNTLYFSFYIFWGGPIIENEFFILKKSISRCFVVCVE